MKLLLLDRDGVINHESTDFIKSPDEWRPIKGSLEAIAGLSQAGYNIVIITNQSGIGRGLLSADMLAEIHVRMIDHIQQHGGKIHGVLFCPHLPEDDCECRKPKTGLYVELADRINSSFEGVYSVGDSVRDLIAAEQAGAIPVLVKTGNGRKSLRELASLPAGQLDEPLVFDNLYKFSEALLDGDI